MSLLFPCFSIYDDEVQESPYGHESEISYAYSVHKTFGFVVLRFLEISIHTLV